MKGIFLFSSSCVCHSRRPVASTLLAAILCLLCILPLNSFADEDSWNFAFFADSRSKPNQTSGVNSNVLNLIARKVAEDIKDSRVKCELVLFGATLFVVNLEKTRPGPITSASSSGNRP